MKWMKSKLVQSLYKTVRRLLKILKIELPYDPGVCPRGVSHYTKGTCTPMFIATLFTKLTCENRQDSSLLLSGLRRCGIYMQ
jgi:hypothetical protein